MLLLLVLCRILISKSVQHAFRTHIIHVHEYILFFRNLSVIENLIAVMMAMCVGALGALVLAGEFYYDFWMFLFCFIMAGCQYSLIKSVQPDAASPMHVSISY